MFPHLFRRATSDDTQNTVLDAIFIASISLLFLLLIAVAILHCIVKRRKRQASSNWPSRRALCVITPQSKKGPEQVYVLELSPASAKDVEKALQKSSLGVSDSQYGQFSPFSANLQPVPLAELPSSTPMQLDNSELVPVYPSNVKVDAQSPGAIAFYANSGFHPPVDQE